MSDPGSHRSLIAEDAFARLLQRQCGGSLRGLLSGPSPHDPCICRIQVDRARELLRLLDVHEARFNRRYALLAELLASLHCLGRCAQILHHIRLREPQYPLAWTARRRSRLHEDLERALTFLDGAFEDLQIRASEECFLLGFDVDLPTHRSTPLGARPLEMHLPHDLDEEEGPRSECAAARVLGAFAQTHRNAQSLCRRATRVGNRPDDRGALEAFVSQHFDEAKARDLEAQLHNLQSSYDTALRSTTLEREHPKLATWRGHVSLAYHLAEFATQMVHFYERHEDAIQHPPTRHALAELIDRDDVLRWVVHFSIAWIGETLDLLAPLDAALTSQLVKQIEIEVQIPEGATLHARPLSQIVAAVTELGTPVELELGGESAPASSLLSLLLLAGRHIDETRLRLRGDARALRELQTLFAQGLWNQDDLDLAD